MASGKGKNTPEYLTVQELVNDIKLAIKPNLLTLGGQLEASRLITTDNNARLRNLMFTEAQRAAQCVQFIQDRIEEDASNYTKFYEVLMKDKMQNESILKKLHETYVHFQRQCQWLNIEKDNY